MPDKLRDQISAEIKRVQSEIDQQKRLIKNNIAKKLMAETAARNQGSAHSALSARSQSSQSDCQKTSVNASVNCALLAQAFDKSTLLLLPCIINASTSRCC
jgi:hypothetical protein